MRKISLLLLFLIICPFFLIAQDEQLDDMDFEEIPVVKERPTYFAIGAGYVGSLNYFNLDEINKKLTDDFHLSEYKTPLYLSGVHGFTGIGIIPDIRLGFFGFAGSQKVSDDTDSIKYGSVFSASLMGFTIDYGFVLFKHFAILPGLQIGWSSLEYKFYRTLNTGGEPNWDDINSEGNSEFFSKNIEGSFIFIQPQVYFEYALTPFLMARASLGYNFSFSPKWEYNSSAVLKNVPDKITTNGLSLQFGVFVGLFNF